MTKAFSSLLLLPLLVSINVSCTRNEAPAAGPVVAPATAPLDPVEAILEIDKAVDDLARGRVCKPKVDEINKGVVLKEYTVAFQCDFESVTFMAYLRETQTALGSILKATEGAGLAKLNVTQANYKKAVHEEALSNLSMVRATLANLEYKEGVAAEKLKEFNAKWNCVVATTPKTCGGIAVMANAKYFEVRVQLREQLESLKETTLDLLAGSKARQEILDFSSQLKEADKQALKSRVDEFASKLPRYVQDSGAESLDRNRLLITLDGIPLWDAIFLAKYWDAVAQAADFFDDQIHRGFYAQGVLTAAKIHKIDFQTGNADPLKLTAQIDNHCNLSKWKENVDCRPGGLKNAFSRKAALGIKNGFNGENIQSFAEKALTLSPLSENVKQAFQRFDGASSQYAIFGGSLQIVGAADLGDIEIEALSSLFAKLDSIFAKRKFRPSDDVSTKVLYYLIIEPKDSKTEKLESSSKTYRDGTYTHIPLQIPLDISQEKLEAALAPFLN